MQIQDDLANKLAFNSPPQRIVSLCPSITETLIYLDRKKVVGRTKFCIHPREKVTEIQRVGGTKNVNLEKIIELNPDLIIAEKEENTKEIVEKLQKKFPVFVVNIEIIEDAYRMIESFGFLMQKQEKANNLLENIKSNFQEIYQNFHQKILYFIWENPKMIVGKQTYINSILTFLGFENILLDQESRYYEVSNQQISQSNAEFLLLSTEPFPFKEKHLLNFEQQFPDKKVILVDGEIFSWYGVRMLEAMEYFQQLSKMLN